MSASRLCWLALLAPGCIVYQVRRDGCEKCGTGDTAWVSLEETGDVPPETTDPEPTDPEPTDPEPTDTGAEAPDPAAFALDPAAACPGDTLVVHLTGPDVVGARFGAGATVRDAEPAGADAIDLLVEAGSAPGVVAVTVEAMEARGDAVDVPLPDGFLVRDDCG